MSASTRRRSLSARKSASVRRASQIAGATNRSTKPSSPSEFCKLQRAAIDCQILTLQYEIIILDELSDMPDCEKMDTLFELLNENRNGTIGAVELMGGLRKINGDAGFDESLEMAIERANVFDDSDGDANLGRAEFEKFVNALLDALGCPFQELCEMLVMQVLFSVSGNTGAGGESVSDGIDAAKLKEEEALLHMLADERMEDLFDLFDLDGDGSINFKELVIGMYKVTDSVEGAAKAAMPALLVIDENDNGALDFEEFTKLVMNIITATAASSNVMKLDDMVDTLMRLGMEPMPISDEEISGLFAMDGTLDRLKDLKEEEEEESEHNTNNVDAPRLTVIELAKVDRLFDVFDSDGDDYIHFAELALGLRKFQETTDLKDTVDQCIKAMRAHDTDSDGERLDRTEFAQFVAKFAKMADSSIVDLADFMIVTIMFKENSESESEYIKSITASDLYYWGCHIK